jgi:thiol peroxidase
MKGNPLTLIGPQLQPGDHAPDFSVVDGTLSAVDLEKTGRNVRIISVVPLTDTPVCDLQTKRFNEEAKLGVDILTVSMDLPFAQRCGAGVDRIKMLSDHRTLRSGIVWHANQRSTDREPGHFCAGPGQHHPARQYVKEVADHPTMMPWLRRKPSRPESTEADGGVDLTLESRVARAAGSPLVRGGLTVVGGILTGNVLGFCRVALTAYLLGTHSAADSLAVAIGPIDTINAALINTIIFAFVPMLTERDGARRMALFLKIQALFVRFFVCVTAAVLLLAPQLIRLLAPGLPAEYVPQATAILRIGSLSTVAAGLRQFTRRCHRPAIRPSAFQRAT